MLRDLGVVLEILDLDIISALLLVPVGPNDLVLGLDVFVEVIFSRESVEVVVDFLAAGIDSRPIKLRLE